MFKDSEVIQWILEELKEDSKRAGITEFSFELSDDEIKELDLYRTKFSHAVGKILGGEFNMKLEDHLGSIMLVIRRG
ncbi:MAG: hypothetical protein ACRDB0_01370 [Paraclostridium sp.]